MIIKDLVESDYEEKYSRLSVGRQLIYHLMANDIDKEEQEYIVAVDMDEKNVVGHIIKMHYDDKGWLITDGVEIF